MPARRESLGPGEVAPTRIARAAHRVGRTLGRLDLLAERVKPWMVLGTLILGTWLVMVFVGTRAIHNSWMYYHGGDGTFYYTTAWLLGHGRIPDTFSIGYGYSLLLAPFARIAGASMLAGLPSIIFFNAIVLAPIALLCIYGLAKAIGGRRFAYLASALWVIVPLLAIPYFYPNYHRRYVGQTLPATLGLTTLGDFPSMVCLLVAAYFGLRAISSRRDLDALTSGLAVGLALAVKPANAIFLPAAVAALAWSRRPRAVLVLAAGLVPSLVCLTIWKYRGLGYIPLFQSHAEALAAGFASSVPVGLSILHGYPSLRWDRLSRNVDGIREYGWSLRLLMWMILGGLIGLARRSIAFAIFVAAWFAAFLVVKGSSVADTYGGSFFRYLAPAFPAVFLLVISLPLLVPLYGRRLAARGDVSGWPETRGARRGVLAVAGFLSLAPIVLLLVFRPLTEPLTASIPTSALFIPANQFTLHAVRHGRTISLSWPAQSTRGARVKYAVYRAAIDQLACGRPPGRAMACAYPGTPTIEIGATHWLDQPPKGQSVYRVAVVAGAVPPMGGGDYILLSRALTVDMPA